MKVLNSVTKIKYRDILYSFHITEALLYYRREVYLRFSEIYPGLTMTYPAINKILTLYLTFGRKWFTVLDASNVILRPREDSFRYLNKHYDLFDKFKNTDRKGYYSISERGAKFCEVLIMLIKRRVGAKIYFINQLEKERLSDMLMDDILADKK